MDIKDIIAAGGGAVALARSLGIKHSSVCEWRRVPAERLQAVSKATGVPPQLLRPELYEAVQSLPADESTGAHSRANHVVVTEGAA